MIQNFCQNTNAEDSLNVTNTHTHTHFVQKVDALFHCAQHFSNHFVIILFIPSILMTFDLTSKRIAFSRSFNDFFKLFISFHFIPVKKFYYISINAFFPVQIERRKKKTNPPSNILSGSVELTLSYVSLFCTSHSNLLG